MKLLFLDRSVISVISDSDETLRSCSNLIFLPIFASAVPVLLSSLAVRERIPGPILFELLPTFISRSVRYVEGGLRRSRLLAPECVLAGEAIGLVTRVRLAERDRARWSLLFLVGGGRVRLLERLLLGALATERCRLVDLDLVVDSRVRLEERPRARVELLDRSLLEARVTLLDRS